MENETGSFTIRAKPLEFWEVGRTRRAVIKMWMAWAIKARLHAHGEFLGQGLLGDLMAGRKVFLFVSGRLGLLSYYCNPLPESDPPLLR